MALSPAVTGVEQLADRPVLGRLLTWNREAVPDAKFDRNELTIWIDRFHIREACAILRDDRELAFNFLSDITAVDWYPSEPRFEVVYQLFSIVRREYLRLKVRLSASDPSVESVTSVWPAANFFEREV